MKTWIGERAKGAAPAYRFEELPRPVPGPGEVLIRVRAVGLNLVDRFPKQQHFQHSAPSPAAIPGMEVAGEVVDGGRRVMAMVHAGCAEYTVAHESLLMPIPASMSWTDAAAIPVAFCTAHDALVTQGRFAAGQALLVQGVTTGVGLSVIQLARVHGAALVAGTSRSRTKLERARPFGMTLGIVYGEGMADEMLDATGDRGADVVIDHLGARALRETLRATAIGGRVVNVGRYAGTRGEIDLETLALRRIHLIGVTFRTRSLKEHAAVVRAFMDQHANDLESGMLKPVIDSVLPFDQLPHAIARAERGEQFGKLVLEL
jgi:NADPH2:quinone reductase